MGSESAGPSSRLEGSSGAEEEGDSSFWDGLQCSNLHVRGLGSRPCDTQSTGSGTGGLNVQCGGIEAGSLGSGFTLTPQILLCCEPKKSDHAKCRRRRKNLNRGQYSQSISVANNNNNNECNKEQLKINC